MHSPEHSIRQAFRRWLRTGRLNVEVKYNPWHDPRDGRFTFAPGGPRSLDDASNLRTTSIYVAPNRGGVRAGRGHNQRPFNDPITLEQAFPSLRQAPGEAIIAVADQFFDFSGPATEAQIVLLQNWSKATENEIGTLDPGWRNDRLGPLTTVQGHINRLNELRWKRATTYLRMRGDARPLQVETLRFVQEQATLPMRKAWHC